MENYSEGFEKKDNRKQIVLFSVQEVKHFHLWKLITKKNVTTFGWLSTISQAGTVDGHRSFLKFLKVHHSISSTV